MPFNVRRYRLRKPLYRRRRLGARRLPLYAKPSVRRRFIASGPTFSETYRYGNLYMPTTGTGISTTGIIKVRLQDLPQVAQYQALYNQYCIKRVVLTLIPAYNQAGLPPDNGLATNPVTAPRFVYSINDSAQQPTPSIEQDVLTDNGCKIRMLTRPLTIAFRPVAEVGVAASTGGYVSESKRYRWLSMNNPEILHAGVSWAITPVIPPNVEQLPACTVYAKVTFSLRDPK